MASYVDSDAESEFSGFEPGDIGSVPDLDLSDLSDISVSSVSSDDSDSGDDDDAGIPENEDDRPWTSQFTPPRINDFTETPGPNLPDGFDEASASPLDFFWLLFPQRLLHLLVLCTNGYAVWKQNQPGARADDSWYPVTFEEMRAFIGINIMMGICQMPESRMFWSSNPLLRNDGIAKVMTCNRFSKILQYLHASDRAAEPAHGTPDYDRLFKIRPIIDAVSQTFQDVYTLSREVSIDEAMIAFSGRLSYRQYMPAKPIKRGIKVWVLCDASNSFMSRFQFYLGRQNNRTENGLGHNVVMSLTDHIRNTHRFCFFDNFFTGIPLMRQLLDIGLYACGTVRVNRKGFPAALKNPATVRNRGDFKILQKEGSNLTASVWKDKRLVYHLSTLSDPQQVAEARRRNGATEIQLQQPAAVKAYNQFMGGVDLHDQHRAKYEVGRKGKKAWRYIFWFLLNCSIVNAFVLYKLVSRRLTKKKRFTHLDFRIELVQQLISGFNKRKLPAPEPMVDVIQMDNVNLAGHESVRLPGRRKECKQHKKRFGFRGECVWGCKICGVHLCRKGCHQDYHQR